MTRARPLVLALLAGLAGAAAAALLPPHGLLDRAASFALLDRRRPPVADRVVALQDLYRHAVALDVLRDRPDARALVDADLNLFVVSADGADLAVHAVVWASPRARRSFHALRAWHGARFPDGALEAPGLLHHPDDRTKWEESDGLLDDL